MKVEDIIRKNPANHNGYMPQYISETMIKEKDLLTTYRILHKIPAKITAYFHRNKMKAVFKSDCFGGANDYYLILTTDNTIFHVDF